MTQAILIQSLVILSFLFTPVTHPATVPFPTPEESTQTAVAHPTAPEKKHYTVASSDTLEKIAKSVYGDEDYWTTLWNDNHGLSDPAMLHVGDTLLIRTKTPHEVVRISRPLPTPTATPTLTITPTPTAEPKPQIVHSSPSSFDQVYQDAGRRFGVPWQILSALHLLETGRRDGDISSGYGPQGPMQFLPGTFASYAIDGNGDGVSDINNAVDAIYTAANYLAKHGSIDSGLSSYGGNHETVKSVAKSLGWSE